MTRIQLARQLRALHRPKDALEQLESELAHDPESVSALIELAWTQMELGEETRARQAAQRARELQPDNPYACYAQANVEGSTGHIDLALQRVDEALDLLPQVGAFHSYRAALCLCKKRVVDALASSAAALEIDPEDDYALDLRVTALREAWRDAEAFEALGGALTRYPEHTQLLVHFGELSLARNDPTAAGNAFRSALRLDPGSARAKQGLIDALQARSFVYRRLSGFVRRSERIGARCWTPKAKRIVLLYLLVSAVIYGLANQHGAALLLFVPVGLAFYLGIAWFVVYLLVRFVVPIFLVRVFFDSLGKAALKDKANSWWHGPGAALRQVVMLGVVIGSPCVYPPLFGVIAVGLPFYAAKRLNEGRTRQFGFLFASLAACLAAAGSLRLGLKSFDDVAGNCFAAAAAVSLPIVVLLVLQGRRAKRTR